MTRQSRFFLQWGAAFALAGVLLGAIGTHGLRSRLSLEMLEVFGTAVQYHIYHALGLIGIGLIGLHLRDSALLQWSGWFIIGGIILFSGSLYLLALSELRVLGFITPIGGAGFIVGWLLLIVALRGATITDRQE